MKLSKCVATIVRKLRTKSAAYPTELSSFLLINKILVSKLVCSYCSYYR